MISDEYIADHVGDILNNYRLKGCLRLGVLTTKPVLYIPNWKSRVHFIEFISGILLL